MIYSSCPQKDLSFYYERSKSLSIQNQQSEKSVKYVHSWQ